MLFTVPLPSHPPPCAIVAELTDFAEMRLTFCHRRSRSSQEVLGKGSANGRCCAKDGEGSRPADTSMIAHGLKTQRSQLPDHSHCHSHSAPASFPRIKNTTSADTSIENEERKGIASQRQRRVASAADSKEQESEIGWRAEIRTTGDMVTWG